MIEKMPLVSVIMNCYNGAEYLQLAIESVFKQTYPNWEIIFWDNASTDSSAKIAQEYSPRLKYFRGEKNVPLGAARALAISKASGEFLAFLDTDDLWFPNRLERGVQLMEEHGWAMCYAGTEEINPTGSHLRWVLPEHKTGHLFEGLLQQFDVNIPTLLIRKSALDKHGINFDGSFHCSEEYNLSLRLAARETIGTIFEYLGAWRCHQKSTTGKTVWAWAEERERTLKQVIQENPGVYERYKSSFDEAFARANYYRACYYIEQGDRRAARHELAQTLSRGLKYQFLYLLLWFPDAVWNLFHSTWVKRKVVPAILSLPRQLRHRFQPALTA